MKEIMLLLGLSAVGLAITVYGVLVIILFVGLMIDVWKSL